MSDASLNGESECFEEHEDHEMLRVLERLEVKNQLESVLGFQLYP